MSAPTATAPHPPSSAYNAATSNNKQKTKLVIRHLPIDLTLDQFNAAIAPYQPSIDYQWFEPGKHRQPNEFSRHTVAYLNVTDTKLIPTLVDLFLKTESFKSASQSLPVQVEFAPSQRIYRKAKKDRQDKKEDTIDNDDEYKQFVASLQRSSARSQPANARETASVDDDSKESKSQPAATAAALKPVVRTPIIDFLVDQMKREKARAKGERFPEESSKSSKSKRARNALRAVTRDDERRVEAQRKKKAKEKEKKKKLEAQSANNREEKLVAALTSATSQSTAEQGLLKPRGGRGGRGGRGRGGATAWTKVSTPAHNDSVTAIGNFSAAVSSFGAAAAAGGETSRSSVPEQSPSRGARGGRAGRGRGRGGRGSGQAQPNANNYNDFPALTTQSQSQDSAPAESAPAARVGGETRGGRGGRGRRGGRGSAQSTG